MLEDHNVRRVLAIGLAGLLCYVFTGPLEQAEAQRPPNRTYKIQRNRLGRGSSPSGNAYKYIARIGCLDAKGKPTDDAGHIIGKALGGPGNVGNIFPQHPGMNRGAFRAFEQEIAKMVAAKHGGRWVYKQPIVVSVSFNYGGKVRPDRPTRVNYCYEAVRLSDKRTVKNCRAFGNPQPTPCFAPGQGAKSNPGSDREVSALISRASAFIRKTEDLRRIGKELPRRYVSAVCSLDVERRNGPEWRRETAMYENLIVRRVSRSYEVLLREHRDIMNGLKRHTKRGAHVTAARRWHRNMTENFRKLQQVKGGNLRGLEPRRQALLVHNHRQHERLQRKWGCEQKADGTERQPDCIDYDKCAVLEFAPSSSRDLSSKRAQAIGAANRLNARWKRSPPSRARHCFAGSKKGFEGRVDTYSACR